MLACVLQLACAGRSAQPEALQSAHQKEGTLRREGRIPPERQPTDEELESAFGGGGARSDGGSDLTAVGDPAPSPQEEAFTASARAFEEEAAALEAAVPKRGAAEPGTGLGARGAALEEKARALGPEQSLRAVQLHLAAARAEGDLTTAHALAWRWLEACGPTEVDGCRRSALTEVQRTAEGAAEPKRVAQRVADVRAHDGCLRTAEGAARKRDAALPPCLAQAQDFYRREGDRLMTARAAAARAESKARAEQPGAERELERAEALCTEPRCQDVRRRLLQRLAQLHLAEKRTEAAARAALRDVGLNAESLPPAERTWAWTDLAERSCLAHDAAAGVGSCRKLERALLGRHHFRDFSQQPPGAQARRNGAKTAKQQALTEGLAPDTVRTVNAHYAPLFEACFAAQAQRLQPPAHEQYTVRWSVKNDGRVIRMEMDRKDLQDSPLSRCLREALAHWRYPRFTGELQHVEQSFGVTARARAMTPAPR